MRLIQTPVCGEPIVAIIVAAVLEGNSGRRPSYEAATSAAPLAALDFPCESLYGRMGIKRR